MKKAVFTHENLIEIFDCFANPEEAKTFREAFQEMLNQIMNATPMHFDSETDRNCTVALIQMCHLCKFLRENIELINQLARTANFTYEGIDGEPYI